jgi:predicted DNA-binding transcriptional regulator AlpA
MHRPLPAATTIAATTPDAHSDQPACVSGARVAEMLGCSPGLVIKLRRRGAGPPYLKIGARVAYPVEALRAWIAARTQGRVA